MTQRELSHPLFISSRQESTIEESKGEKEMFTKRLFRIQAGWFAGQEGLEVNKTMEAFAHDSVHAVLGLGVTLEAEELVLNVQQSLLGYEVSSHMVSEVTDTLAKLINQDIELFMELQTFIESVFGDVPALKEQASYSMIALYIYMYLVLHQVDRL